MRSLFVALTIAATGCTGVRDLGSLSEGDAMTVYTTVRRELRIVHAMALSSGEPLRAPFEYGCSAGQIVLRVGLDEIMHPASLHHRLNGCTVDNLTFDGELDYVNLDPCDESSGTFKFSAGGIIDIAGGMDGFCYMEVHDRCGVATGHVCGFLFEDLVVAE